MKKQSPNEGKSGVVVIFALTFVILSLCLPAVFESSMAMSRQVGVDARRPRRSRRATAKTQAKRVKSPVPLNHNP